jgi:hypothetical protein
VTVGIHFVLGHEVTIPVYDLVTGVYGLSDASWARDDYGMALKLHQKALDYGFLGFVEELRTNGQEVPVVVFRRAMGEWQATGHVGGSKLYLGNGHHRLAACILLGCDIRVKFCHRAMSVDRSDGSSEYSNKGPSYESREARLTADEIAYRFLMMRHNAFQNGQA